MERTDNQLKWDAKRLLQEYLKKADLIDYYKRKPFDDMVWSNQIRVKRIASALRAFIGMEGVEEKPIETTTNEQIETIASEPEKLEEIEPEKEELTYKPVEKVTENEPNVSEIIPSNNVNFDTFEVKEKEEKKPAHDESDYDDFFDDFFDE